MPNIHQSVMGEDAMKDFISKLKELNLKTITGEMIGDDFCHDEYPGGHYCPEAVVEASSTQEVAELMKLCNEFGIYVTVRGAGTGQSGGSVPVKGGIVLSLKNMNKVLGYENGVLRVQSGVMLQEVKAEAEKNGMYYPPDPGEPTATIGGNAATNAGGPSAVKYGKTRDYILDAVIVLADGSVETLSNQEEFSSVIGSEGALAVITELNLKVIERPGADAILLFPFMEHEDAIAAAKAICNADFAPAVVELLDTDLVEFSAQVTGNPVFPVEMDGERVTATLMVTIEGEDDDDVMEKMEAIAGLAEEGAINCLDILVGDTSTMKREFWDAYSSFHASMESGAKSAFEVNVDVPVDVMTEMISFAKEIAEVNGFKAYIHAHVMSGGMHIHIASDKTREETAASAEAVRSALYAKVNELDGDIAGEYGIGYAKVEYLCDDCRTEFEKKKVKFDPKGILNPGKII